MYRWLIVLMLLLFSCSEDSNPTSPEIRLSDNTTEETPIPCCVTPEMYLQMWLSEQIPTSEWLRLLEWRSDINELYQKHLEKTNVEHKSN